MNIVTTHQTRKQVRTQLLEVYYSNKLIRQQKISDGVQASRSSTQQRGIRLLR